MPKIRLYTVTMPHANLSYEDQVEQACEGGVDAILFKDPGLSPKAILAQGAALKDICRKHRVQFLVAGRPDLAFALNADGVHLEPDDIPIEWARQATGPGKLIVVSAFSFGHATSAAQEGADMVVLGPIYSPAGQDVAAPPHGVDIIRLVKKRVKVPLIAAGGITLENVGEAVSTGADGVLAMHAIMGAPDIRAAVKAMKEKINGIQEKGIQ